MHDVALLGCFITAAFTRSLASAAKCKLGHAVCLCISPTGMHCQRVAGCAANRHPPSFKHHTLVLPASDRVAM